MCLVEMTRLSRGGVWLVAFNELLYKTDSDTEENNVDNVHSTVPSLVLSSHYKFINFIKIIKKLN